MIGKIIKGIAGFYYVNIDDKIYECHAKGIFRNKNIKPVVGDNVVIDIIDDEKKLGSIIDISDRKNELIRPSLSNIDYVIIFISVDKPKPQPLLIDKYILSLSDKNVDIAIVWNKIDLKDDLGLIKEYENAGIKNFRISTKDDLGIEEIREFILNKTVALAGPSGVGKSSFVNKLCPVAEMETNTISRKIDRGRHTTRHSELFLVEHNTYICDTPGFSNVDISYIDKNDLWRLYPEFNSDTNCRFSGCVHINEPDCAIKEAVKKNIISKIRYDNYIKIYNELSNIKKY